ncbi:hypothetical protein GGR16_003385 [Chelatococcus caeni]|uniref:Regulatory protein GemA n=1 Tax=Chelatococcus caeni TaxID=1348468 RepID=A0A840C3Z7_9HYPH|nr:regulatory protein GemA [Chelatococcus caeni]MBB4018338.1 hypothetical protein [Chelatococcus caeni]
MPLPSNQLAVIHLAKKSLGLDDETYRAVLTFHAGVSSAKDLTPAGFEAVMRYFNACGFRSTWNARTFGRRPGMATPRQIDLIRSLWRDWSGADDEQALGRWLERSFGVSALRFLSSTKAGDAINGLKAMIRRKDRPSNGK